MAADIFGQYGVIIGQLLSVIAICTLLIQLGRWWTSKRGAATEPRVHFVLLLIAIIATNIFSMLRSLDEIQETQKLQLIDVKISNTTLQNQQMIKHILKQGDTIINKTNQIVAHKSNYLPLQ